MWGKFWFGADRQTGDSVVPNPEVQGAERAALIPEPAARPDKTPLAEDQAGEIDKFLSRVYTHQQC